VIGKLFIPPKDLRTHWHYVRPRLEIVLKKSPESWIPEDIYADILMGSSMLWLMIENGNETLLPLGFIVGQKQTDDTFFLWAGFCEPKIADEIKWHLIEEATKASGCNKIAFESWRRGWETKAKKLGFKPRKYIKELQI
tara:strand:- start:5805 stop:6221 length:417 start_codon:yes stop_codon:yes gene_type:complete